MPQIADLVWARYDTATSKQYLLFYIGAKGTQTLGLFADKVPDHEIQAIRANINNLKAMGLDQIVEFLKEFTPTAYRVAFRRFQTDKLTINNAYGIKKLTSKSKSPSKT